MGTQYSEVYEWFLKKVTYYSLEMLDDVDKEETVNGFMKTACARFKCCKVDLSKRSKAISSLKTSGYTRRQTARFPKTRQPHTGLLQFVPT